MILLPLPVLGADLLRSAPSFVFIAFPGLLSNSQPPGLKVTVYGV